MFSFIISGSGSAASTYYYTITSSANGVDLWSDIVAANGGVPSQTNIEVTINSGVEIGAVSNSSPTNYALDVSGQFASNSKNLTIINNGYIGGFGGKGGEWSASTPTDGQDGGSAINFNSNATLINNGTIAGGGGGGAGGSGSETEPGGVTYYADGGGGAGLPAGTAGGGYPSGGIGASNGTKTSGGIRSLGVPDDQNPGGNGGDRGASGGTNFETSPGAAGYSYQLGTNINVAYSGSGTRIGSVLA